MRVCSRTRSVFTGGLSVCPGGLWTRPSRKFFSDRRACIVSRPLNARGRRRRVSIYYKEKGTSRKRHLEENEKSKKNECNQPRWVSLKWRERYSDTDFWSPV